MPLIVLGILFLIVAAFVAKLAVLWGIGIVLIVIGIILIALSYAGGAVSAGGGRRYGRMGRWW